MKRREREPLEVGLLAQETVRRLRKSATKLAIEDSAKCKKCKDIGLVQDDDQRWRKCTCKIQVQEPKQEKGKFF